MEKEREELRGELKGIQDQRRQNEEEQKRALQHEEDRNYQNEQDIKNIDRQLERWQNEPQLFGLLSDQWKAMKKLQSVRNGFIEETKRETNQKRRELDEREEECNSRLNALDNRDDRR